MQKEPVGTIHYGNFLFRYINETQHQLKFDFQDYRRQFGCTIWCNICIAMWKGHVQYIVPNHIHPGIFAIERKYLLKTLAIEYGLTMSHSKISNGSECLVYVFTIMAIF